MKQKILIGILLVGIAIFGFLIWQKKNSSQMIYSFGGQVLAISDNSMTLRVFERQPGQLTATAVNKKVEITRKTEMVRNVQASFQPIQLSDIKPESLEYQATEVTVYTNQDPMGNQELKAYRIELTKEANSLK